MTAMMTATIDSWISPRRMLPVMGSRGGCGRSKNARKRLRRVESALFSFFFCSVVVRESRACWLALYAVPYVVDCTHSSLIRG